MIKEITRNEFINFLNSIDAKKIGAGTEAECYLGNDGNCYKLYSDEFINIKNASVRSRVKEIITTSDVSNNSFIFPDELYIENGVLLAHKTKYIPNNIFGKEDMNDSILRLTDVQLRKAYIRMLIDIVDISKKRILMVDSVGDNILFDGEKMCFIDTCEYKKTDYESSKLYIENKKRFESGLEVVFNSYYDLEDELSIEKLGIDEYIKKIKEASINYGLNDDLAQINTEKNKELISFASSNLDGYLSSLLESSNNSRK